MAPKSRPKRARRTYTPEQRQEALALYKLHGTAEAARQTGIPKGTIDTWRRRDGVKTSVTKNTREASDRQKETFRERRYNIIHRLYDIAENSIELLENPKQYQTIGKAEFGVEVGKKFGFVPAREKQQEATAIGIMLDKAERLEKQDADNGARETTSLLDKLAAQIGGDLANERPSDQS